MMQKNITTIAFVALLAVTSFAQGVKSPTITQPEGPFTFHLKSSPAVDAQANKSTSGFYEGFELQSQFDENWEVKRSSTLGTIAPTSNATSPKWFLCSPGSFYNNGAQYIHTGQGSAAIGATAKDYNWLISKKSISVQADDNLNFWMYYVNNLPYDTTHFHVAVIDSNQGVHILKSWGTPDEGSKDEGENSSEEEGANGDENNDDPANGDEPIIFEPDPNNPLASNIYSSIVTIPLGEFEGQSIRLAFIYNNRGTANNLAIDNISIGEISEPILNLKAQPLPYSQIPHYLVDTMEFRLGAYIQNIGADLTSPITLEVSSTAIGVDETLEITDAIPNGVTEYFSFPNKVSLHTTNPRAITITYTLKQAGEVIATSSTTVNTTEGKYAVDYGEVGGLSSRANTIYGNLFPIERTSVVSGIEIGWSKLNSSFASANLHIYQLNPVDQSLIHTYSQTIDSLGTDTVMVYKIDDTYLTPGFTYFIGLEQVGNSLGVGFDRSYNGHFWRLNNNEEGLSLSRLTNRNIGNIAIRAIIAPPEGDIGMSLTLVNSSFEPVSGATVTLRGIEQAYTSDGDGLVSIDLDNGQYYFTVTHPDFAPVHSSVLINNTNVERITMLREGHDVTFIATPYQENGSKEEGGTPGVAKGGIANVEIFINNHSYITDSVGRLELSLPYSAYFPYHYTACLSGYSKQENYLYVSGDTLVNIYMHPDTSTVDLAFKVITVANAPLKNALVRVRNYGSKLTDSNGEITFTGVSSGIVSYNISSFGFNPKDTIKTVLSDTTILVKLVTKGYDIILEVLSGNLPVYEAYVSLERIGTKQTSMSGVTLFKNVAPNDSISLFVSRTGFENLADTISLGHSSMKVTVWLDSIPPDPQLPEPPDPPGSGNNIVQETEDDNKLMVYPNPSTGVFTVRSIGIFNLEVIDLTGRIIARQSGAQRSATIDISTFPSGMYLVRVISEGRTIAHRIIKR